jgi:hypothetical protein
MDDKDMAAYYQVLDEMVNDCILGIYSTGKDSKAVKLTNIDTKNPAHIAVLYVASAASLMFNYKIKVQLGFFRYEVAMHHHELRVSRAKKGDTTPEINVAEMVRAIEQFRSYPNGFADIYYEYYKEKSDAKRYSARL